MKSRVSCTSGFAYTIFFFYLNRFSPEFSLCAYIISENGDASYLSQIRDSNRAMLLAATSKQECQVLDLGIVRDSEQDIEKVLEDAVSSGVDILITSGGVSMGDRDFVKPLLGKRGRIYFDKVLMAVYCKI